MWKIKTMHAVFFVMSVLQTYHLETFLKPNVRCVRKILVFVEMFCVLKMSTSASIYLFFV